MEALVVDESFAFQELAQESLWLEQQRRHLQDQRTLLDLERAELEHQLAELTLLRSPRSWISEKRCLSLTMRSFA